jgi:hypothetical protein
MWRFQYQVLNGSSHKNVEYQWLDDVLYGDFNNRVNGSSHEDAVPTAASW